MTKKLVRDQKEIQGTSVIDWQRNSWKRSTLLTDRAVQLSTARTYVFSDSVLCMGKMKENPMEAWNENNRLVHEFIPNVKNWIELTGSRWSSSGKFPRIHCIADPRQDPDNDG